jgi:hypothetical protein
LTVLVGADPEFFLKKGDVNVSAHDIVPGDKSKPFPLAMGAVQRDGTAVEFNIKPAVSSQEFTNSIECTLADIRKMVPADLEFDFTPSVIYPKDYFDAIPQGSKELGCDPDFNAYTESRNTLPQLQGRLATMRTGAGHIHIGWTKDASVSDRSHFWDCCTLVKALDAYFQRAVPLWDQDNRRRQLYGALGAFRPKPYGVEYRVLSNAWLKYPKLWPWLFNSVQFVFEFVKEGKRPGYDYMERSGVRAVNNFNRNTYGFDVPLIPADAIPPPPVPEYLFTTSNSTSNYILRASYGD